MKRASIGKRIGYLVAFVAIVGLLVLAWYATRPGPMAFADAKHVALSAYDGHPTGAPADLKDNDPLARGRYLTDAADCKACHTNPGGMPFAGGRAFKTGFGTLYSPNITPDTETGIGAWNDADFLKAVHQGVNRNGERLYPAFPYDAYTYLTDEDVLSIKAYLFTLPAVKSVAPPNNLSFPFNQRRLMSVWSLLFNPNERFEPAPDRGPEWNRGAYLVEALAHCGDCHTPRNLLQALDNKQKFAGALIEGWRAYNITADTASGVGGWSDEDLAQYLASGHAKGRGTASGPMAEAVALSLTHMTAGDIHAMVAYLRTVPAIATHDLPAPKAEVASADPIQGPAINEPRGMSVFAGACAGCHGWSGQSPLASPASLIGSRAINDPTAANVAQMVLWGSQYHLAEAPPMPGFGAAYNDDEIAAVSNYVTARFGAKPSTITAKDVRGLRDMH
jgi:mono/diheme cytochrome c family protein